MTEEMQGDATQKVSTYRTTPIPDTPNPLLDESPTFALDKTRNSTLKSRVETVVIEEPAVPSTPEHPLPEQTRQVQVVSPPARPISKGKHSVSKGEMAKIQLLQERCKQICLSIFLREDADIHSIGFTSSLRGEGKSFLATVSARTLASDSSVPITLVECNWEHPSMYQSFGLSEKPGLAEWLRGECSKTEICHRVSNNLSVIPAGDGKQDAVKLLNRIRQQGLMNTLSTSNELLIVDLPPVVPTAYGSLAARLVDALIFVVRAKATPTVFIEEAHSQLKDLPVQGVILNQIETHIPRWIRQLL